MFYEECQGALEAVLFAAGEPMKVADLAQVLNLQKPQIWELASALEQKYKSPTSGLLLRILDDSLQLVTKPEHYSLLTVLSQVKEIKLSNAALETLAIVAFKQPVTRGEMEAIRGVKVDGVVNTLLDLGLLKEAGRKKVLGNPVLYATTEKFLQTFGMASLEDLPKIDLDTVVGDGLLDVPCK